jgi:hypothetical protein
MPDLQDTGWRARPAVHGWRVTGVEADLGALAEQLQRCSEREPPLRRCAHRAGQVLVLTQRHLVTVAVTVAVVSATVMTAF